MEIIFSSCPDAQRYTCQHTCGDKSLSHHSTSDDLPGLIQLPLPQAQVLTGPGHPLPCRHICRVGYPVQTLGKYGRQGG